MPPAAARSAWCRWRPTASRRLRTALAMGAAKAVLVSDPALAGSDALTTAKVLAAVERPRRGRPDHRRHRVDRRLHRHGARADRRGARPAVGDVRQARRGRRRVLKVDRQTEAGYDEVDVPAARRRQRDGRRGRASLPELQGDHGRQVEAGRHGHRRRPRRRAGRLGRRRPGDRRRRRRRPSARPARSSRTTARATPRSSSSSTSSRSSEEAESTHAVSNIWVFAQGADGAPTSATLELLTKARQLGGTVDGVRRRRCRRHRRRRSASTARRRCTPPATSAGAARRRRGAAMKAVIDGGDSPDLILFPQDYEGRDVVSRLSVKLDRRCSRTTSTSPSTATS